MAGASGRDDSSIEILVHRKLCGWYSRRRIFRLGSPATGSPLLGSRAEPERKEGVDESGPEGESTVKDLAIDIATAAGVWRLSGGRRTVEIEEHPVEWIVRQDGARWAIIEEEEVWRRGPDGDWQRVATSAGLALRTLLPVADGLLVGSAEAHLYRCCHGPDLEPLMSFEFAPGRDDWFTPWGGPPDVRSMAVDDAGRWYVNVHVGGILRSDDEGGIWQPTAIDIETDVHQVVTVAGHPDRVVAATGEGLAQSEDGGATWTIEREGLHATYCRAVAALDDRVLVSASDGPRAERAAVYRGRLDGSGLEKCSEGLPEWFSDNIDTGCLAMRQGVAVFGTRDGRIYASDDGGESWSLEADDLPRIHSLSLR